MDVLDEYAHWRLVATLDKVLPSPENRVTLADEVEGPDCRRHDVPNLWVCDGSVWPTVGAVNPSLTIEALATRTARLVLEAT